MVILACMKNDYREPINTITKINSDLEALMGQSQFEMSTTIAERVSATAARHYNKTRKQAISLYTAFKEVFQDAVGCACNMHTTHLQLDSRFAGVKPQGRKTSKDCTRFNVILNTPANWSAIELEPVDVNRTLEDPSGPNIR